MIVHKLLILSFVLVSNVFSVSQHQVDFSCDGELQRNPKQGNGRFRLHIEGKPEFYQPDREYTGSFIFYLKLLGFFF